MKAILVAAISATSAQSQCQLTTLGGGVTIDANDLPPNDPRCCTDLLRTQNFMFCTEHSAVNDTCNITNFPCPQGETCMTNPSGFEAYISGGLALPTLARHCSQPSPCWTAAVNAFDANGTLTEHKQEMETSCEKYVHTPDFEICEATCNGFVDFMYGGHDNELCESRENWMCFRDSQPCGAAVNAITDPILYARLNQFRCDPLGEGICGPEIDFHTTDLSLLINPWEAACVAAGQDIRCDVSQLEGPQKDTFCNALPVWTTCGRGLKLTLERMFEKMVQNDPNAVNTHGWMAPGEHPTQAASACRPSSRTGGRRGGNGRGGGRRR